MSALSLFVRLVSSELAREVVVRVTGVVLDAVVSHAKREVGKRVQPKPMPKEQREFSKHSRSKKVN